MGVVRFLVLLSGALLAGGFAWLWNYELTPPDGIPMDGYWGPGDRKAETKDDEKIALFSIKVDESVLTDLKQRLSKARLKTDLEDESFQYGFRSAYMGEVIDHWQKKYDWRKHEKILNSFDNFKTNIEGIDIHFLRAKPKAKTAKTIPLLMVHGWPGSVWEFYKILPMLTNEKSDVTFDVICPSIPGYGYSEAPHKPGFDQLAAARVFRKLMLRLGYEQFYTHGGDWGAIIVMLLAQVYPENVLGMHSTMPDKPTSLPRTNIKLLLGSIWPSLIAGDEQEAEKSYPILDKLKMLLIETGYFHLQATRPDTIGLALNDSPVGLAAYILEKFSVWTNQEYKALPDGGITKKFSLDELLTNVMIYWTNGNIASSQRFYKELFNGLDITGRLADCPLYVPAGIASFPDELVRNARTFLEDKYRNIIQHTNMPRGGHFPALEEPKLLADDIISFVQKVELLRTEDSRA